MSKHETRNSRVIGARPGEGLKSLGKLVEILNCFSTSDRALSIVDIERRTGLPRSTAHRLASSLREIGFLDQAHDRDRYRLGVRLFQLGQLALTNLDLHRESRPILDNLRRVSGFPAHVAIFDGRHAVVVQHSSLASENPDHLTMLESAPVYCTSVGKSILAHQPEEVIESIIADGLVEFTETTLAKPEALRAELALIREQGYAVDNGEHQPGIRCVGAPIKDELGRVLAAVSVTSSSWQLTMDRIPELAKVVIHHAASISRQIGGVSPS